MANDGSWIPNGNASVRCDRPAEIRPEASGTKRDRRGQRPRARLKSSTLSYAIPEAARRAHRRRRPPARPAPRILEKPDARAPAPKGRCPRKRPATLRRRRGVTNRSVPAAAVRDPPRARPRRGTTRHANPVRGRSGHPQRPVPTPHDGAEQTGFRSPALSTPRHAGRAGPSRRWSSRRSSPARSTRRP